MPTLPAWVTAKLIGVIVGVLVLTIAVSLFVRSCDKRRSEAAQARVERSQAEAASTSAADAVNAVERSGEASRASEELTRNNERDIRNAQGASDRVNSGVDLAGRKALCKRAAYRNDPKCKVLR